MMCPTKRGARGCTLFFHDPTGAVRARHFGGLVDVLGTGAQSVIPPSPHAVTGQLYTWLTDTALAGNHPEVLPVIRSDIGDRLSRALRPWLPAGRVTQIAVSPVRATSSLPLSTVQREGHRRYVQRILESEMTVLAAMAPSSGRNEAAFRLSCRVGRWVHAGVLKEQELSAAVLEACHKNGLIADDGRQALAATIASGLRTSSRDALPNLGGRAHV